MNTTAPARFTNTRGGLDGFTATCSCGLEMRNALYGELTRDIAQHEAWHTRCRHSHCVLAEHDGDHLDRKGESFTRPGAR